METRSGEEIGEPFQFSTAERGLRLVLQYLGFKQLVVSDWPHEVSFFCCFIMTIIFSRTMDLMGIRSIPAAQVRKYILSLVGFCLNMPIS